MPDTNTPRASSPAALARMNRQKQKNTKPELALRSALHRKGLRSRVDLPPLPRMRRRADIVFTRAKLAVYVDGCFWHGCPIHATWPKANAEWWRAKIERNTERDRDTDRRLEEAGWRSIRVWEHEDVEAAAARIFAEVRGLQPSDPNK